MAWRRPARVRRRRVARRRRTCLEDAGVTYTGCCSTPDASACSSALPSSAELHSTAPSGGRDNRFADESSARLTDGGLGCLPQVAQCVEQPLNYQFCDPNAVDILRTCDDPNLLTTSSSQCAGTCEAGSCQAPYCGDGKVDTKPASNATTERTTHRSRAASPNCLRSGVVGTRDGGCEHAVRSSWTAGFDAGATTPGTSSASVKTPLMVQPAPYQIPDSNGNIGPNQFRAGSYVMPSLLGTTTTALCSRTKASGAGVPTNRTS